MTKPASDPNPASTRACPSLVWASLLLALVTMAVYWPATGYDFVNFDDQEYVTANSHVQAGLTWEGAKWALVSPVCCNWHPLTVLSHMCVCQVCGMNAWGHHLANVLLHALNAVLVFALLTQMTRARWRSLLVAALFALHPLRVESVAWVSERKDVLGACFGLLTLILYVRYAAGAPGGKPTTSPNSLKSRGAYLLSLACFALGLMSKPMLVTWPFVMLLLDYWPLRRVDFVSAGRLVREKVPFFVLALAASAVTFVVQQRTGSVIAAEHLPLGVRCDNALISYCRYLGRLFWPADLAVFYPHPGHWSLEQVLPAAGLILAISWLCWTQRRRFPFLLIGWLWFVGMLVPMIGLVQTGRQAMADRHTYLPSLGVLVMVVWGGYEVARGWRYRVVGLGVAAAMAIGFYLPLTRQQLRHWSDSEALFRHALAVTENNCLTRNNLGFALEGKGQFDEAILHLQEAIRLNPDSADPHNNLGAALAAKGRTDEAIRQYQEAVRLQPDYAQVHNNLGLALGQKGLSDEAIKRYQEAIRLKPDYVEAHYNLGTALAEKGQTDAAIRQFEQSLHLDPHYALAHDYLGLLLDQRGETDEAIRHYQQALRWKPDYAFAHNHLGVALGKKGEMDAAIGQFQEALRLKADDAEAHQNLGLALYRKGQFDRAINEFEQALRLQPDSVESHHNLGIILAGKGQVSEAILHFQSAIRLNPDHAETHYQLGLVLGEKGQLDDAIGQFQEAVRLSPEKAQPHYNLAIALGKKGQLGEAIHQYEETLRLEPDDAQAHNNLGNALFRTGRKAEAVKHFEEAVRLRPDYADARKNLDLVLGSSTHSAPLPGASGKP